MPGAPDFAVCPTVNGEPLGPLSDATPVASGTAAPGTGDKSAREDHDHGTAGGAAGPSFATLMKWGGG